MKLLSRFASLLGWMFLILFTLKLLGKITVSWWIVTLPLWGPLSIIVAGIFISLSWVFAKGFKESSK